MMAKTFLSDRGYALSKDAFPQETLDNIRKELTVKANVNPMINTPDAQEFPVYMESSKKLYVPKYYGLKHFGAPDVDRSTDGASINLTFKGKLRKEQLAPVESYLSACKNPKQRGGIINIACGGGKCLAANTPIIMYDGSIKMVQDINVGDQLMGNDSTPRNVLSICTGYQEMYKITPRDSRLATEYTVNSSHILSLKHRTSYDVINMSISEYLKQDELFKEVFIGYTCIPKYFGCSRVLANTRQFLKISFDIGYELFLSSRQIAERACSEYISYSIEHRNALLMGIKSFLHNGLKYSMLDKEIVKRVIFIARSTGYNAYVDVRNDTLVIDLSRPRDLLYEFDVHACAPDTYYGFEIDGNHLFLLGDFTVTHNTVLGLYITSVLSVKTMIVVHKEFLLNQWKERIQEFLPEAKVGIIKAKQLDVVDKDIVIASLQSLSMKDYSQDVFKDFGLVILDEVHRTATEIFSNVFRKFTPKFALGLSATVKRQDGLAKVFMWFIGDIVYTKKKKSEDDVIVKRIEYYHATPSYSSEERVFNRNLNISKMINNICTFLPRTRLIISTIVDILSNEPERKILVLSDRKTQLYDIHNELHNEHPKITCGYYIGGMNEKDLKLSEACSVILATFSFASEGFDVQDLDTLILASPKTNIEQSVGRILRKKSEDRTRTPIIYDVVDMFSIFVNQGNNREKYYKKSGFKIEGKRTSTKVDTIPEFL